MIWQCWFVSVFWLKYLTQWFWSMLHDWLYLSWYLNPVWTLLLQNPRPKLWPNQSQKKFVVLKRKWKYTFFYWVRGICYCVKYCSTEFFLPLLLFTFIMEEYNVCLYLIFNRRNQYQIQPLYVLYGIFIGQTGRGEIRKLLVLFL